MTPRIEEWRYALKGRLIDAPRHWRILFLGRSVNGSTDIVSCLSRALRNLGHKVLAIDTKRHGRITINPNDLQGGHGPIEVDLAALRPAIERFRPHIIAFAAGGLCFSAEDSEAVRAMGPILVGITLSDPDVFPTVSTYAGRFDFHTTNAAAALEMYEQAGIRNTLYFPFGIDRGYVTQTVPPAPDLKADVICLGHAISRPERNDAMLAVAKAMDGRFTVRGYGRGWRLPKAEVVEGQRMIQASRNGRVHINFAGTRAGYTNVKVGVFETIGSGALLATSLFPEMERFFTYGQEILGFADIDDLTRQLAEVLGDPARYEAMVERAFRRLIDEHLYEHRWLDLFAGIEAALAEPPTWLDAGRAEDMRRRLDDALPRARQVILSGFYGARNAGDEMILRSIAGRIEAAAPETEIVVAAENPAAVELDHGLNAFKRSDHVAADGACRTASAVVLGGGGLWHDYTFARAGGIRGLFTGARFSIGGFGLLPQMAHVREIPFHVLGMGVGPLDDPDARLAVRHLAGMADSITVRDEESLALLRSIIAEPDKVAHAPDVVYALDLQGTEAFDTGFAQGRPVVGVNMRRWPREAPDLISRVAAALDAVAVDREVAFLGIPMQLGERHDRGALASLFELMSSDAPRQIAPDDADPAALIAALRACDLLLAMRLHACLLGHRLGIPTVGIAYDPKVARHFEEVGRADCALGLDATPEALSGLLLGQLASGGGPGLAARTAPLEAAARAHLDAAAQAIASAPARRVIFEVPPAPAAHEQPDALSRWPDQPVGALAAPWPDTSGTHHDHAAAPLAEGEPAAAGWERVSLGEAEGTGTSLTGGPAPEIRWAATSGWIHFGLGTDVPAKGDCAEMSLDIPLPGTHASEIRFEVESRYYRPKNRGWIRYEVLVDGEVHLAEDIALRREPNIVTIYVPAGPRNLRLSVRVRTVRQAQSHWRWSWATMTYVRDLAMRTGEWEEPLRVIATSPASLSRAELAAQESRPATAPRRAFRLW